MIIKVVKFKTALSEREVLKTIEERASEYRKMPGLLQKYYIKDKRTGEYGGVYVWDSAESMEEFQRSDLYRTIPEAYKIVGQPTLEVLDVVFKLRP